MISASEGAFKARLSPEKYEVLREKATERPFSSDLLKMNESGVYVCGACGAELFSSKTKYNSGSGWPSFWDVINEDKVILKPEKGHGIPGIEVLCSRCKSHLGHVFSDGPKPTGKRYCINGMALEFRRKKGV